MPSLRVCVCVPLRALRPRVNSSASLLRLAARGVLLFANPSLEIRFLVHPLVFNFSCLYVQLTNFMRLMVIDLFLFNSNFYHFSLLLFNYYSCQENINFALTHTHIRPENHKSFYTDASPGALQERSVPLPLPPTHSPPFGVFQMTTRNCFRTILYHCLVSETVSCKHTHTRDKHTHAPCAIATSLSCPLFCTTHGAHARAHTHSPGEWTHSWFQ